MSRPNEGPLPEPLAFFLTWATYGTWLPGDERGWIKYHRGWQPADKATKLGAAQRMTEDACILDADQRRLVEKTITAHCELRCWVLHAVNCRTTHVHVVVTAPVHPKRIRDQLKAWCARRLREAASLANPAEDVRSKWWAERGSRRYINAVDDLEAAIQYVRDFQDRPRPTH